MSVGPDGDSPGWHLPHPRPLLCQQKMGEPGSSERWHPHPTDGPLDI